MCDMCECGMCDALAKMNTFNLFFVWKFWHFLKCIDKLHVKNFMQNYKKQIQINLQK